MLGSHNALKLNNTKILPNGVLHLLKKRRCASPERKHTLASLARGTLILPQNLSLTLRSLAAYDSGQTHLLLQTYGTLPITYRSATYHIPICIWFPLEYPRKAPIMYVQPTREMAIRGGGGVEMDGRVTGGVVEEWGRKWEVSQMTGRSEGGERSMWKACSHRQV